MEQKREKLGSRLGFILLSAGCAIGCGNVWKFPWQAANFGGGIFVLFYILCLVVLGLPVMTMEFSIGRAAQKSPVKMYQALEKPNQKWHIHGYVGLFGNVALMAFYTIVTGWILRYFVTFVGGQNATLSFGEVAGSKGGNTLYLAIVVVLTFVILAFDIQKGLEKVTKFMMVGLLALMIGLAIYAGTLSGAGEGYKFYLVPNFKNFNGSAIVGAMNQAFFTLSIGMGSMAIFGSYINKDRSLLGESVNIISLDTGVAILAGLIMFPAIFANGLESEITAGPGLLFGVMGAVFNSMGAVGRWIGALFFLFMVFAAFSTVLAVCENILAMVREIFGFNRPMGCIICGALVFVMALPCAVSLFGFSWIDIWDFLVSTNILPLGSLTFALFCCNKFGWGWDNFINEANAGEGLKVQKWMKPVFQFVVPAIIIFLYIYGMITFDYTAFGF